MHKRHFNILKSHRP